MQQKLLSICIPTYNRAEKLSACLTRLYEEKESLDENLVEIIVSDNCSNDNTEIVVNQFIGKIPIRYIRQTSNIGVTKNVIFLGRIATGKYIWHIADDDIVNKGVITKVITLLKSERAIDSLFINYRTLSWGMWYKGESGFIGEGKKFILRNFEKLRGGFMFLTANIVKRNALLSIYDSIDADDPKMLAISLIFPIVSVGEGNLYILDGENIIDDDINISWSEKKDDVTLRYRFECLLCLQEFGYTRSEIQTLSRKLYRREKYKITAVLANEKKTNIEKYKENKIFLKALLGYTFAIYEYCYIIMPLSDKVKDIYKIRQTNRSDLTHRIE